MYYPDKDLHPVEVQHRLAGPRSDQLVEVIKTAILTGRYRAGEALTESGLAEEFGTSKTPVREALKRLSSSGLATSGSYKGMYVRTVDEALAGSVFELRLLLEPVAVRRTVMEGVPEDALRAAVEKMDMADTQENPADRSAANRAFHRLLYSGCGNPMMIRVLDDLKDVCALISVTVWQASESWVTESKEHRRLAAKARAGRADEAARLTESHIRAFHEQTIRLLGDRDGAPLLDPRARASESRRK